MAYVPVGSTSRSDVPESSPLSAARVGHYRVSYSDSQARQRAEIAALKGVARAAATTPRPPARRRRKPKKAGNQTSS